MVGKRREVQGKGGEGREQILDRWTALHNNLFTGSINNGCQCILPSAARAQVVKTLIVYFSTVPMRYSLHLMPGSSQFRRR